ncbi:hypothetical protein [Ligilactobacillus saerimneri]|uniref:hypothetical protein n=1 Tax=Ligilactobacillus saerimneri TaxID=228229 RepID=UPI003B971732
MTAYQFSSPFIGEVLSSEFGNVAVFACYSFSSPFIGEVLSSKDSIAGCGRSESFRLLLSERFIHQSLGKTLLYQALLNILLAQILTI